MNRYNRIIARRHPAELKFLMGGIERVARNMTLVRALGRRNWSPPDWWALSTDIERTLARSGLFANAANALTPFAGTILIVVLLVVSQRTFHTSGLLLISFLYLFMRFIQAVSSMTLQFSVANQYAPAVRRLSGSGDGLGPQ